MTRKLAPLALAALAIAATAACASVNTEPDEVAVVYNAARGSATTFSRCVGASARQGVSASDNTWTYPAGQRFFKFSSDPGAESGALSVVSKDNVQMEVTGVALFALNTSCQTLRQFHERIGLKTGAYFYGTETAADSSAPDTRGWASMLATYFQQPLDRALDAAAQEFEWKKLFNDPAAKQAWEQRVGVLFAQFVKETTGGAYFCGPNYAGAGDCGQVQLNLNKPEPPASLVEAMASEQAAKQQNLAQRQLNARVKTELESIKDLVKVLGPDGYVLYQAIKDGKVTVVPIPAGGAINVTPKK